MLKVAMLYHEGQLPLQIQHMMKVKSKNEDLVESNAQLQAEVKRLQQDAASKPVAHDSELQVSANTLLYIVEALLKGWG